MTDYIVLLTGDEQRWDTASEEERATTFARHDRFSQALEERGHVVTGGAELAPSARVHTVRTSGDGEQTVTEGPYVETVEQLGGFYLVTSDDLDDLAEVCRLLDDGDGFIEIRECVAEPQP